MASNRPRKTCILHLEGKTTEKVKSFTEETWTKVLSCQKERRHLFATSKFFAIELPEKYDDNIGYHMQCYCNFTAVPKNRKETVPEKTASRITRSETTFSTEASTGVFPRVCLFCDNATKSLGKNKGKEQLGGCETTSAAENIKEAATSLNDYRMLSKIADLDLIAKEVKYHHSCKNKYIKQAQREQSQQPKEQSSRRNSHEVAFKELQNHINEKLVQVPGAETLKSLHLKYLQYLGDEQSNYAAQSLQAKILDSFPMLAIAKASNKQGSVVHNRILSHDDAIGIACCDGHKIRETALYLRSLIIETMNSQSSLPSPLSAEVLASGQCKTPPQLLEFLTVLLCGGKGNLTEKKERRVQSVADDIMFTATRGKTKPGKQLCLGLAMKSFTGSRRVIEILNRLGHSVSYHMVEEYETELATVIQEKGQLLPDGLIPAPGLCTAVAFDNYDELCETLSGAGTLHDTVGICYQNISEQTQTTVTDEETSNAHQETTRPGSTRRSFTYKERNLEPYRKKPKMSQFAYDVTSVPRPQELTLLEYRDCLWMMSLECRPTPMWTGWNSLITEDVLPKQRVLYLENLTLPPTRNDVVLETMKMSQQIAQECGEDYMLVHYDLAIARPALQIQAAEAPRFDNLFVAFGPFHISLAFFGALGYLIDSSGGPEMLTESGVLASGSLHGFLSGKHYNRYVQFIFSITQTYSFFPQH